jgi:hypothetical protein
MVAIYLPPAWLALVPIIVIEAGVGIWRFKVAPKQAFIVQTIANCASTILGLPITWLALALVEFACCSSAAGLDSPAHRVYAVTVQSPWLIPYESDLWWMIPASVAALTVPFYFMSVVIEYGAIRLLARQLEPRIARSWALQANLFSYGFLLVLMASAGLVPGAFDWLFEAFRPLSESLGDVVFLLSSMIHPR